MEGLRGEVTGATVPTLLDSTNSGGVGVGKETLPYELTSPEEDKSAGQTDLDAHILRFDGASHGNPGPSGAGA
eukprot:12425973-Karenia_brevis.AAC.1